MRKLLLFILLTTLLFACKTKYKHPHVLIQTNAGDIEVEVYPDQAPKSAGAFLSYVDSGLYKNSSFYRVLNTDNQPSNAFKAELIQGGIWRTNYKKRSTIPGIPHETTQQTHLLHKNGTISLARLEPGTAGTEFFICIGDQPGFDFGGENNPDGQGYAAFGRVVKGMNIVQTIYNRPETDQAFTPQVAIFDITRL
ncbi:peptidylprolyl isomerase [Deminuibacter soli]|uniref:peptidylprolyl isomerase n=1 Tax=Deminuibacter soli TaxID=2291815 RepID=A0A3E1NRS1_9BACT|nr:peptidylprolyl isomerase [Deminuibacter soli]RFM30626.1 peptidylprolyl isomerase [Deminuibacter soli]